MATQMEGKLGELICKRTPYTKMELPDDWEEYIEWDGKAVIWQFRELPRRVTKAIRIPVTITVTKGTQTEEYLDWLLIGYEGGGGM